MSLAPIDRVLGELKHDPAWAKLQRFWTILQAWPEIVGEMVAQQTQPLTITSGHRLQVAVSSGVWAQTLTFERSRILAKLNQRLKIPLHDIQFSSRGWSGARPHAINLQQLDTLVYDSPPANTCVKTHLPSAQAAFEQWSAKVQKMGARLPLCPCCQCPTPRLELDLWQMCGLCQARRAY